MRSSPRRGAGGVEHAGTQHAELELADAALHAEKKPIIRSAGVVHPIQVDHSRFHQAAEFEQMVPVAAITSEPGGVEAQHGANLSGTQPCNQSFEAGPRHHPTGGTAEIVIDHLDIMEAPLPRDINKLVLPPL